MTSPTLPESRSSEPPYLGYGVHGLGGALMVQAPGLLLLIYMTDTLAIPAALAGLAMFAPRIMDVVTDPLMGMLSDRTKSRWGRRRPYLLLGAIVTGLSACFLFSAPLYESVNLRLAYVMLFYILMVLGSTIFLVPVMAMISEITDNYHERTKLMSVQSFFTFVGMIAGGVLAPLLVLKAGGGVDGYALMSVGLGIIVGGSFLATFFGTRKCRYVVSEAQSIPLREQLKIMAGNRPFKILVLAKLLFAIGIGSAATMIPYYVSYTLATPDSLPMVWGISQAASILSIPLWIGVSKRLEKHNTFKIGFALLALGSIGFFFIGAQSNTWLAYANFVIFGMGVSAVLMCSNAMLPDVIQWDAINSGSERGGVFSGAFLAADKCGFALGALTAGTILGLSGYIESTGGAVAQPDSALLGIRLVIGIVPCFFMLIGLRGLMGYSLTERVLKEHTFNLKTKAEGVGSEPIIKGDELFQVQT